MTDQKKPTTLKSLSPLFGPKSGTPPRDLVVAEETNDSGFGEVTEKCFYNPDPVGMKFTAASAGQFSLNISCNVCSKPLDWITCHEFHVCGQRDIPNRLLDIPCIDEGAFNVVDLVDDDEVHRDCYVVLRLQCLCGKVYRLSFDGEGLHFGYDRPVDIQAGFNDTDDLPSAEPNPTVRRRHDR